MRLISTNMQARKMLFAAIPSICASSSKKISIYNEEMIVARCFIGFIIFSRKSLGKTFKVTLDGRIQAIQEESQQFPNPNEVVPPESNEQQRLLRISLRICGTVVESLPMARCAPKCEKTVQALLCRNLNVKSATLPNATSSRRIRLQDDLVTGFHFSVSERFVPGSTLKASIVELIREGLVVHFIIFLALRAWVGLLFSLAGMPGKLLVRLPWGINLFSGFLIRVGLVFVTALVAREAVLVLMNNMGGFMPVEKGSILGGELNKLPGPPGSSDPTFLVAAGAGDQPQSSEESWLSRLMKLPTPISSEDTGSPSWGAPLTELFPLEGEHGLPTEGGADMEAGPSNSEAPEPKPKRGRFINDTMRDWKPRDQIAQDEVDKKRDRRLIQMWEVQILEQLRKIGAKPKYFSTSQWKTAMEALLQGETSSTWYEKLIEFRNQRETSPFFLSLVEWLKQNEGRRKRR